MPHVKPSERFIDTHAHLDFPQFDGNRDSLFARMKHKGISRVIIPGVSPQHWQHQLKIAIEYACPFALGIHPWFCTDPNIGGGTDDKKASAIGQLSQLLRQYRDHPLLVAVGECGLDNAHQATRAWQLDSLQPQLALAKELNLPVILHVVKAHGEMLQLLKVWQLPRGGVIHAFSGSAEIGRQYLKLGFKLGIGGILLKTNARKLPLAVASLPLESFVLETDSPFMSPQSVPLSPNSPLLIRSLAMEMARIQKKPIVHVSEQLLFNSKQVFDL